MSTRETFEKKLGKTKAQDLIDEINAGINAQKTGADLETHINNALTKLGITDSDVSAISTSISKKVQPKVI